MLVTTVEPDLADADAPRALDVATAAGIIGPLRERRSW